MRDGRNTLKAAHPRGMKSKKCVSVYFEPEEYRVLYDAAAVAGISLSEVLRRCVKSGRDSGVI